jgi:hypothetical protein
LSPGIFLKPFVSSLGISLLGISLYDILAEFQVIVKTKIIN